MDTKSKIKQIQPQIIKTYETIKDMIPQPVKDLSNKSKIIGDFVHQKLIILAIVLNPDIRNHKASIKEVAQDIVKLSKEELIEKINQYKLQNKKVLIALYLVGLDIFYEIILFKLIDKAIPDSFGYAFFKIIDKIFRITSHEDKPQKDKIRKVISIISQKMKQIANKLKKITNSKVVEKVVSDFDEYRYTTEAQLGKFFIKFGFVGAVVEESSKTVAHHLGAAKQYMIIFNAFETAGYIIFRGANIKDRVKTIFMHIALQIMHRIPKLRKYTYIIHGLFNITIMAQAMKKAQK